MVVVVVINYILHMGGMKMMKRIKIMMDYWMYPNWN